jgi:peptidoglycan/LPS O-acetylase OafA/YrhL
MTESKSRICSLDGLRALAISLVLLDHSFASRTNHSWWLAIGAHAGVLLFFSISGFLITSLLLREDPISIPKFYVRRVWRIFPVLYAYLLIVTLLHHNQFSWGDIALSWTFLASIGLSFFDPFPWSLSHLWSLSVEEMFYLAWPLLLAVSLSSARYAAWATIIIAPLFRFAMNKQGLDSVALFSFPAVADSLATGCLVALYSKPLTRWVTKHRRWLGILWPLAFLTPALIVIGDQARLLWPLPQLAGHLAWSLFNMSVGLGILWAIIAKPRILNHPISIWLGVLSYSLYVWHMPFMNPELALPFPLNLALAFAAAILSYYLIEQPILQLRTDLKKLPSFALANS